MSNRTNILQYEVTSLINLFFSQTSLSHLEYYSFNGVYINSKFINELKILKEHKDAILKEILNADDLYLKSLNELFVKYMLKSGMNINYPAYGNEQE